MFLSVPLRDERKKDDMKGKVISPAVIRTGGGPA